MCIFHTGRRNKTSATIEEIYIHVIKDLVRKLKIQIFQDRILDWFSSNGRSFEWRKPFLSEYEIIISEILLQRTKAETVSKFYNNFLADFPNWYSLASAKLDDIEHYLTPIGLYRQRAKRLHNLAIYMDGNHFTLPIDRKLLDEVPFMGQYIANAVELLIHNKNKPLLDVNMARVLERYFGPRKLSDIRYDPYLQNLALKVVNHPNSKEINWAILDFAAIICKARKPQCDICLFNPNCLYYQSNLKT